MENIKATILQDIYNANRYVCGVKWENPKWGIKGEGKTADEAITNAIKEFLAYVRESDKQRTINY